jgi:hypothetical protein
MNVILRKIKNAPSRCRAFLREIRSVIRGLVRSVHEAALVTRRLRNTRTEGDAVSGTAVINSGWSRSVVDIELYLAHLLALKGLTVYVLYDDGVLDYWDGIDFQRMKYYSPYKARWCVRARHVLRKHLLWLAYKSSSMHCIDYSTMVRQFPPAANVSDDDIPYALGSTKRFFQTGVIDTEGEHRAFHKKSLRNCAVSHAVGQYVLNRLKPDLYITSHGIYSIWGPAYRIIKKAEIPTVIWQTAPTAAGFIRLIDRQDSVLASTQDWLDFDAETPADSELLARGHALLDARISHRTQDTREYFGGRLDTTSSGRIVVTSAGTSFGMFPNVVWDGDTQERNLFFDNVVHWCEFSINAIRDTEHHLYIRFHPSEVTRLKGTVKLQDIIRKIVPDVDALSNVTLIDSEEGLDTYMFARNHVDVGLVYDGTLCVELTHMGIPVIACTNGNFTPESIVYVPDSQEHYRDWIQNPAKVIERFEKEKDERFDASAKYACWLFRDSMLEFGPLDGPYPAKIDYGLVKAKEPLSRDQQRIYNRLIKPLSNLTPARQRLDGKNDAKKIAIVKNSGKEYA